jgi:hypothetical protein
MYGKASQRYRKQDIRPTEDDERNEDIDDKGFSYSPDTSDTSTMSRSEGEAAGGGHASHAPTGGVKDWNKSEAVFPFRDETDYPDDIEVKEPKSEDET